MDESMVAVPNVIGFQVSAASEKLIDVELEPSYKDPEGKKISNPNPEWYVQPGGQSPQGASRVPINSVVTLIIAASTNR